MWLILFLFPMSRVKSLLSGETAGRQSCCDVTPQPLNMRLNLTWSYPEKMNPTMQQNKEKSANRFCPIISMQNHRWNQINDLPILCHHDIDTFLENFWNKGNYKWNYLTSFVLVLRKTCHVRFSLVSTDFLSIVLLINSRSGAQAHPLLTFH